MNKLEDALKVIDGVGHYSGGCAPFKDMKYFQHIEDDETVIWYETKWIPTNFEDEEQRVIIFKRIRTKETK